MKRVMCWLSAGVFLCVGAAVVQAGKLQNGSFETDFGQRENLNVWGDYGDSWGEAYQVDAGKRDYVKKARTGDRCLLINVPASSWNGVWQQIPWVENKPFLFQAHYLIKGGNLPPDCSTFLKVEYYDGSDALIGMLEGDRRKMDTDGKWLHDQLMGTTPPATASIRLILIGGSTGGPEVVDRIYWDDAEVSE